VNQRAGSVSKLRIASMKLERSESSLEHVESSIEDMRSTAGVRWVVVVQRPSAEDGLFARDLAERLNLVSDRVCYVSDDADAPYTLTDEEPDPLTWVFRMNRAYVERERAHVDGLGGD